MADGSAIAGYEALPTQSSYVGASSTGITISYRIPVHGTDSSATEYCNVLHTLHHTAWLTFESWLLSMATVEYTSGVRNALSSHRNKISMQNLQNGWQKGL